MRIIRHPQIRFEHSYSGVLTVLEGAELSELFGSFFRYINRKRKKTLDFWQGVYLAVVRSYESVHGPDVMYEALHRLGEKRNPHEDADARKLDLFYKGMLRSLLEIVHPNRNWERVFRGNKYVQDIVKDIASLDLDSVKGKPDLRKIQKQVRGVAKRPKGSKRSKRVTEERAFRRA